MIHHCCPLAASTYSRGSRPSNSRCQAARAPAVTTTIPATSQGRSRVQRPRRSQGAHRCSPVLRPASHHATMTAAAAGVGHRPRNLTATATKSSSASSTDWRTGWDSDRTAATLRTMSSATDAGTADGVVAAAGTAAAMPAASITAATCRGRQAGWPTTVRCHSLSSCTTATSCQKLLLGRRQSVHASAEKVARRPGYAGDRQRVGAVSRVSARATRSSGHICPRAVPLAVPLPAISGKPYGTVRAGTARCAHTSSCPCNRAAGPSNHPEERAVTGPAGWRPPPDLSASRAPAIRDRQRRHRRRGHVDALWWVGRMRSQRRWQGKVSIATSLDGYIARANGDLAWLTDPAPILGHARPAADPSVIPGYEEHLASVDHLVMGRGTYEKILTFGFWPYPRQ